MSEKKQSWFILTVVGVLILIGIVAGAAGGSGKNTTNKTEPTIAKIGEVARDGKFEFTVTSVECGKPSVGTNQYLTKQAQGQFCLVNVTVKNIANEAQTFGSSSQYVYDAANAKFSSDGTASLYANPEEIGRASCRERVYSSV